MSSHHEKSKNRQYGGGNDENMKKSSSTKNGRKSNSRSSGGKRTDRKSDKKSKSRRKSRNKQKKYGSALPKSLSEAPPPPPDSDMSGRLSMAPMTMQPWGMTDMMGYPPGAPPPCVIGGPGPCGPMMGGMGTGSMMGSFRAVQPVSTQSWQQLHMVGSLQGRAIALPPGATQSWQQINLHAVGSLQRPSLTTPAPLPVVAHGEDSGEDDRSRPRQSNSQSPPGNRFRRNQREAMPPVRDICNCALL